MLYPEILCSPEEAFKLRGHITTMAELCFARKVMRDYSCKPIDDANDWNLTCMIADVFNAGKITGIRQERKRRASRHT